MALLLVGTSGVQAQYCDAASSNTTDDWLAGVNFAGIDNVSESTTYSDFTDISGIVAAGGTYEFTATIGNSGTWNQYVTVYIDWNQDEVFNEEDERYDLGNCAFDGCTVVGDILVPAAIPGETRMRVIENWNGFVDEFEGYSCYSETYGEVEDYSLIVEGDCTPPSFVYDSTDNCDSFTYNVQATLNDFSGNSVITIYLNRSDIGDAGFVIYEDFLIGQTVDVITDVPFGVTIEASIEGADPVCNQTRNWSEEDLCPPENNACETAIAIECNSVTAGSNSNGTAAPIGTPFCGEANQVDNSAGVWYTFTSEFTSLVTIGTQNSFVNDEFFVYTGECGVFECILGINWATFGEFYAAADETYYIFVTGFAGANGDFELVLDCISLPCEFPELTAVAVDVDGNEIEGCISLTDPYNVLVTLDGGLGNDDFTVTVGDSTITAMVAGTTHIFGEYAPGSTTLVDAIGNQEPLCFSNTSVSAEVCPPENDDCANATAINCGDSVFGTIIGASVDARCGFAADRLGVWYTFTSDFNAVASLETCHEATNFDTDFSVFTGPDCDNLTCYPGFNGDGYLDGVSACEFAGFAAGGPDAIFYAHAGVTYYILVHGFGTGDNYRGIFEFSIECISDPCVFPELTVEAVLEGDLPIEGCLEPGTDVFVNVDLAGGFGNETYTVNANGTTETMSSPGSFQFGPYNAGTDVNVSVIGDEDEYCEAFGVATSTVCPPPNDFCADAVALPCNGTYIGNTLGATSDDVCSFFGTGMGVWFSYTSDYNVEVTLETCNPGTNFDTDLSVFSGVDCEDLTCFNGFSGDGWLDGEFSCEYAAFAAGGPNAVFTTEPGVTYYILLHGYGTGDLNKGDYELSVSCISIDPCGPEVTAIATNAEGTAIEDCVDQQGEYYVMVTLTGSLGNDFYNVSVNGGAPIQVAADGSGVVGPVAATEEANVFVSGVIELTCAGFASTSVELCPPSNDMPCGAIALPNDGSVSTYSNMYATADEGEATPGGGNCQTNWCEGTVHNSVWFTFVAPESGRVDVTLCGPNTEGHDTQIALYSIGECADYSTYELVAANDDLGFANCEYGSFLSGVVACVEPGETYYVQVDGSNGDVNPFDISVTEADGAICDCVLPVLDGNLGNDFFTFANTQPICDGENQNFSLTFYAPEDLGSQDGMLYTYDWVDNPGEPITILVTETTTVPEIFSLGTAVNITVSISDEECEDADGSIYPLFGSVTQNFADCNPCGAPPGTPCEVDGEPGSWNVDCECIPVPINDPCAGAIPLSCDAYIIGSNVSATENVGCNGNSRQTVWYSFTAPANGSVFMSTCNPETNFDTDINMYTGTCEEDLVCFPGFEGNGYVDGPFACDFQSYAGAGSFEAESGVTYYIAITGFYATGGGSTWEGDFGLSLTCTFDDTAVVEGTVDWNGSCEERDITVDFYDPGTSDLVGSYSATVNAAGEFTIAEVMTGTFDIISKVDGYLAIGVEDVDIAGAGIGLELGPIVAGDINGDNGINIIDVSVLNAAFGSIEGDSNFNPLTDMNCDGGVNIIDVSILNGGFGMVGDSPGEE